MSDIRLKDSKDRWHQVCMQSYPTSCGPACVAMAERIYKHLNQSDETRARQRSGKYPGGWSITSGGSFPTNLSSVLNSEGVKTYAANNVTYQNVYSYLKYYASFSTPVLTTVRWYAGGGHVVLCPIYDSDDSFTFYDPFYGLVEVKGSNFPYYYAYGGAADSLQQRVWVFRWLGCHYPPVNGFAELPALHAPPPTKHVAARISTR